jgi:hypothetical protein
MYEHLAKLYCLIIIPTPIGTKCYPDHLCKVDERMQVRIEQTLNYPYDDGNWREP